MTNDRQDVEGWSLLLLNKIELKDEANIVELYRILIGSNPDIETMTKVRVQKYRLRFHFQVRNDSMSR